MYRFFSLVVLFALTAPGSGTVAALELVATSPSLGALARELAPAANVTVLAPPDRDMHGLQVRPSMIQAVRRADLVLAVGADLEVGWLQAVLASAANPGVLPGRTGYFEAAAQVDLLDRERPADRALGDVHPAGNPHLNLDPVRMAQVAWALAERLVGIDPSGADEYQRRAADFAAKVDARLPEWRRQTAGAPGVLLFHRDAIYLLERFGVPLLGEIEPVPGVPPTAVHLKRLTESLAGGLGVIVYPAYLGSQAPERLGQALGWPIVRLPLEPPLGADGTAYLDHVGRWVDAIASARR
ncbi:MAG: zinc ABC transporter substrate-binding protein [Chromatiaceae bacterium]|jgi:zinc/manganese transport system substrate-binding protein|nr:zinc ABC transporter substrate-binding protein [Chromatiaceae bacterium]